MFKSIFNKLLVTYLIIIISVISILSFTLSLAYRVHIFNKKEDSLNSVAKKVQDVADQYRNDELSKKELEAYLNSMGYTTDSSIYILKLNKETLENTKSLEEENEFMDGYLIDDLKEILEDNVIFRKKHYSKALDTFVVFLGVPLKSDLGIEGSILIFSPVNEITSNITRMNLIIWGISLIAMILSGFFIYINSLRISKPIKEIDSAAKKIASGEETKDLKVVSQDEIGQLALTFNYMKDKLAETESMRREFIASVSHDLKTPLMSINGFIEGIIDGVIEPEEYKESFKIIKSETSRLMKLTNDILQLSKIQSGVLQLSKSYLPVRELLESIVNNAATITNDKDISIELNCDNDLKVYADRDRLQQILVNLISNSIKYSHDRVNINIIAVNKENNVEFRVIDKGVGIEKDKLKLIFEKFYRVEKSRYSKTGGTGLGLSIVKNLIELHGGSIYVKSEVDKGTEMVFTIPK
ncbi:MAG: cell wall metabolism sensor histidine kinase WalK [Clostridia bacterium]|nr:cell wall metabolism sensor histidine kinase WalK [Clostridia bacterium]